MKNGGAREGAGRKAGSRNKSTTETADFMRRVLTDEHESVLWEFFLGHADPETKFKAFRLALEYKRGKPAQPLEHSGELDLRGIMARAEQRDAGS